MEQNYDMLLNDIEILLIEDNYDDAELVQRTFKQNRVGNGLVHLINGNEALDFLLVRGRFAARKPENKQQLILLDLKMPGLDGIQLLKMLKQDERTRHIPVVVMTSSSDAKDIIDSYQLGVDRYVVKPVNFADFARATADLGFYWQLSRSPK